MDYHPTPTEVIASWIPHDARWADRARAAAGAGSDRLRAYVSGLVLDLRDGECPLAAEYDRRTIAAVVEDLGSGGLEAVDWSRVCEALLLPLRRRRR